MHFVRKLLVPDYEMLTTVQLWNDNRFSSAAQPWLDRAHKMT